MNFPEGEKLEEEVCIKEADSVAESNSLTNVSPEDASAVAETSLLSNTPTPLPIAKKKRSTANTVMYVLLGFMAIGIIPVFSVLPSFLLVLPLLVFLPGMMAVFRSAENSGKIFGQNVATAFACIVLAALVGNDVWWKIAIPCVPGLLLWLFFLRKGKQAKAIYTNTTWAYSLTFWFCIIVGPLCLILDNPVLVSLTGAFAFLFSLLLACTEYANRWKLYQCGFKPKLRMGKWESFIAILISTSRPAEMFMMVGAGLLIGGVFNIAQSLADAKLVNSFQLSLFSGLGVFIIWGVVLAYCAAVVYFQYRLSASMKSPSEAKPASFVLVRELLPASGFVAIGFISPFATDQASLTVGIQFLALAVYSWLMKRRVRKVFDQLDADAVRIDRN